MRIRIASEQISSNTALACTLTTIVSGACDALRSALIVSGAADRAVSHLVLVFNSSIFSFQFFRIIGINSDRVIQNLDSELCTTRNRLQ